MDEEFDYIVTPIVFDVSIEMVNDGTVEFKPEWIFGSPGHEIPAENKLFEANSIFPSTKSDPTLTKGGVILVQLKKHILPDDQQKPILPLRVSYKDRNNKIEIDDTTLDLSKFINTTITGDCYQNSLVRKAVLLVRYVNFMKIFLRDTATKAQHPSMNEFIGIPIPDFPPTNDKNFGATIEKLSPEYSEIFKKFIAYFEREMIEIADPLLNRELEKLVAIFNV